MEATMTSLNPLQIHLLQMFSFNRTEFSLAKMKKVLFDFYCKEVERMGLEIAAERGLDDAKLEAMSYEHDRLK